MDKKLTFYICAHCGNIVHKLYDGGAPLSCCGEVMGEQVEFRRHVLDEIGLKAGSDTSAKWGNLIPGLRADRFDVVAAASLSRPSATKTSFLRAEIRHPAGYRRHASSQTRITRRSPGIRPAADTRTLSKR